MDCPKCNDPMAHRSGKHGEFWGCSRFPACRGAVGDKLDATLYTDASFGAGGGGWGAYAATNGHPRIIEAGKCPPECRDSNDAELFAIVAGLELIKERWPHVKSVLVRSDSQDAIRRVNNPGQHSRWPGMKPVAQRLAAVLHGLVGRTAWVKGQQGTRTRPGWVNHKVDALASEGRKK